MCDYDMYKIGIMKKGIGPRGLGSPLKQTSKPKERKKMKLTEVAKEITPGVNALFRVGDVVKRLKDLPEKVSKNKKTNK